jgi:hypothetical protein
MAALSDTLRRLNDLGSSLGESEEQLDEFEKNAAEACEKFHLDASDLAAARQVLKGAAEDVFEEAAAAGVVLRNVSRWVHMYTHQHALA